MNMPIHRPLALSSLGSGLLVLACAAAARLPATEDPADASALVVGTYDSRAVAIAHASSDRFREHMNGLRAELEAAQAAGDQARVAELEALGPALQQRLHAQGFGTASVDALLEPVAAELPALAEATGVDLIVSRWDVLWQAPDAVCVDVTEALVDLMQPDERGRANALAIREQEPVPLEDLDHDH